jgi:hypothetical protein
MANYPRKDKRGLMRFIPSLRQILTLAFLGFGAAVIALAISVRLISVPEASEIATAQTTILYYDDGVTELGRLGEANRVSIEIKSRCKPNKHCWLPKIGNFMSMADFQSEVSREQSLQT